MYLIFDTETTGLPINFSKPISDFENWNSARCVQIAWQLHDEYGKLIDSANDIREAKKIFGKSLALIKNQSKGTIITREMLTSKKPASGIPSDQILEIIGKKLAHDKRCDRLITFNDLV